MSNNPDINMAQGFVTSEPTGNGIKLYANDVDITDELGGSSLPAVTADDNGDVLTVVDGAWGKAAPSGGGVDVFAVVHFFYDNDDGWSALDMEYADAVSAIQDGKILIGQFQEFDSEAVVTCNTSYFVYQENEFPQPPSIVGIEFVQFTFNKPTLGDPVLAANGWTWNDDGTFDQVAYSINASLE